MLRREMSPESQRRFFELLVAGHFITPGEAYSLVTTAPPSAVIPYDIGFVMSANIVMMMLTIVIVMITFCWWRNRKVSVFIDVAVQVDFTNMLNLAFTQYGQCFHYVGCETISRRNNTAVTRRPCLICIPQYANTDAEQG